MSPLVISCCSKIEDGTGLRRSSWNIDHCKQVAVGAAAFLPEHYGMHLASGTDLSGNIVRVDSGSWVSSKG